MTWWALVAMFYAGVGAGIFITALMSANGRDDV